jgi:hypothetical protein
MVVLFLVWEEMVMSLRAIVGLIILVFALSPAVASAQGFLGGGFPSLPGMPSFGNLFGDGGSCDPCTGQEPFSLAGTVGWNYQTVDLDFATLNFAFAGLGQFKHTYRFNGVKLGLTATAISRTGFGAVANFSILATGSSKDTENYGFYFGNDPTAGRHWRTENDNYCFDGLIFYNLSSTAALLGGFRWDHFETTFNKPTGVTGGLSGLPTDEAVLTTNIFQPYVGVMVDHGGPSRVMRVGIVGWPQLYGSAKYGQTVGGAFVTGARINGLTADVSEGYFWEILGEYGLKGQEFMNAALSVFGSWTQYHLKGHFNADADVIGVGTALSDLFNISMHRNSWTVGVKLDIPLVLPVPFYF